MISEPIRECGVSEAEARRARRSVPLQRGWWAFIAVGVTLLVMVAHARFGWVVVVGDSMRPTFGSGDLLVIDKQAYRQVEPCRGDVVVSRFRDGLVVKRVVGLPGETVEVVDGGLRVNGAAVSEKHRIEPGPLNVGKGELFDDRLAVLGDNRAESDGLHFFAVVPRDRVVGRGIFALRCGRGGGWIWRP